MSREEDFKGHIKFPAVPATRDEEALLFDSASRQQGWHMKKHCLYAVLVWMVMYSI